MAAVKFDFRSVLTRNLLDPERHKGTPFTFTFCRDTKEVFFTDSVGNYINFGSILAAVLNGSLPLALPASPVSGPQGPPGIPGPRGESIVGPQGPQGIPGPQGDIKIVGDAEILKALNELKAQRARHLAAFRHAIEENNKRPRTQHRKFVELTLETLRAESGLTREELVAAAAAPSILKGELSAPPKLDEAALEDARQTARRSPDPELRKRAAQRLETLR